MLNPYVPGKVATQKRKPPADPQSGFIDEGQQRGPVVPEAPTFTHTSVPGEPAIGGYRPPTQTPQPAVVPTLSTFNTGTSATASIDPGRFEFTEDRLFNTGTSATASIDPGRFEFTEDRLNSMLSDTSPYIRNARREGLDRAVERGGLNTSIASGLSEREAIRAAAPIAQADAGFTQQRYMAGYGAQLQDMLEGNTAIRTRDRDSLLASLEDTLAGNTAARTMTRDSLLADYEARSLNQQADLMGQRDVRLSNLTRQERAFDARLTEQARDNDTSRAEWLNTQTALSNQYAAAIGDNRRAGLDFLSSIGQAFINDPEVYSPQVVSGMTNFFNDLANGQLSGNLSLILRDLIGTAMPQPVQPPQPRVGG